MEHQYSQEDVAQNRTDGEDKYSLEKWKPVSATVPSSDNYASGGFDCNICLDFVQDPVVTLCGHLYCWPCIYKWLHFQSISPESTDQQQQQCPVCKADVSRATLIPLYGRGQATKPGEGKGKAPHLGIVIPRRPTGLACGVDALLTPTTASSTTAMSPRQAQHLHHRNYIHQPQAPYYPQLGSYGSLTMLGLGGTTRTNTNASHPFSTMFGEMVNARAFGNPESNLYDHPNSYQFAATTSPRLRRHVTQANESLSRICFFLCCCALLCLFLF